MTRLAGIYYKCLPNPTYIANVQFDNVKGYTDLNQQSPFMESAADSLVHLGPLQDNNTSRTKWALDLRF